jgi:tetratricopeptide (TPR) repeat protein
MSASKKTGSPKSSRSPQKSVSATPQQTRSFRERVTAYISQTCAGMGKRSIYLSALAIFFLGFLLYANTLYHDYALDDDLVYKLNSSVKKGISGIPEIFRTTNMYGFNGQNYGAYRPFTQTIFALEYQLFGLNPHMQHLISILLYAITCGLLFLLMKRMFASKPLWVPLIITLLYTVHPLHTEVVANIKSSDELISFLFGFVLSFLMLFRYLDTRKIAWLIFSCLMFLFGLFSKENIITLLPLIPLSIYFFTDLKWKKNVAVSLWYILPALIFLGMRTAFIESHEGKVVYLDNFILFLPWYPERIGTIFLVMLEYLRLLFYPYPQSCDYSYAHLEPASIWSFKPLLSVLLYLSMMLIAILNFKKKNLYSWCILFFLFTLSIYTNTYASLAATMAERFTFLPSLPFIAGIVLLFYAAVNVPKMQRWKEMLIFWPMVIILFAFSLKTVARNTLWKNSDTLFAYDVTNAPRSTRLNKSAGDVWLNKGIKEQDVVKKREYMRKSIVYFDKAYTIYADFPDNLLDMGTAYYYLEQYDTAWIYWQRFAEIQNWSPRVKQNMQYMSIGYYNQGQALARAGSSAGAITAFNNSLLFDSSFHPSWYNLGLAYASLKDYPNSIRCLQKSIRLDSTNAGYWYDYGGLMFTLGRRAEAKEAWIRTLQIDSTHQEARRGLQAITSN